MINTNNSISGRPLRTGVPQNLQNAEVINNAGLEIQTQQTAPQIQIDHLLHAIEDPGEVNPFTASPAENVENRSRNNAARARQRATPAQQFSNIIQSPVASDYFSEISGLNKKRPEIILVSDF